MLARLDDGRGLGAMVAAFREGRFSDDFAAVADRGEPYRPVWAATRLTNAMPDDGRPPDRWVLEIRTYGIVAARTYLIRETGLTESLLDHSIRQPFEPANYSGTRLHSSPVTLAPGETALLMTRLVFGPVARLDLALMTDDDHRSGVFLRSIGISAYYAFMAACLIFHVGFSASMRSRVGLGYGVVLGLMLAFIAYLDGFLFRFAYPERPEWHLTIGIALLLGVAAAGFGAAALSLRDLAERATGRAALRAAGLVCGFAALVTPLVSPEIVANLAYLAFAAMLAAQLFAARQWHRVAVMPRRMMQVLLFLLALVVSGILAIILTGSGGGLPLEWTIKAIFAVVAIWTIATFSLGLVSMRREHEAALRRELAAVSERERIALDLLDSERNYSRARELADRRRARLASVSHDFRQPLASLRFTLAELGRGLDPAQRQRLRDAFDYMDALSGDLLDESRPDAEPALHEQTECYPLSLVLETVEQMFGREASEKGLDLRIVPSSRPMAVPPLILTRIVANLVANAVKYTHDGRVLVGLRAGGRGGPCIVICDTGPGLSDAELARAMGAYNKGPDSEGVGLGLAICHDLAAQHGMALSAKSVPGRGTSFFVHCSNIGRG